MIVYRNMTHEDIVPGLSLCRSSGWNQLARDWEIFLALSPDGCRVATSEEKVVGTVTTIRYENFFSWIGMVLVDPSFQRQGIGRQLLKEALNILRYEETVKLDATPAGREVYLKLDFADEYPLTRMQGIIEAGKLNSSARPMLKNDLPAVNELDREIFGAVRQSLLAWIWKAAPQYAFVVEERNEILGYCMGRPGHNAIQIGSVIARRQAIAQDIVLAALGNCAGRSVILDVPHHQQEWLIFLRAVGFSEQRSLIRMYRGSNRFPGITESQFSIAGPEFG